MAITLVDFQSSGGSEVFHWHLGRKIFCMAAEKNSFAESSRLSAAVIPGKEFEMLSDADKFKAHGIAWLAAATSTGV